MYVKDNYYVIEKIILVENIDLLSIKILQNY